MALNIQSPCLCGAPYIHHMPDIPIQLVMNILIIMSHLPPIPLPELQALAALAAHLLKSCQYHLKCR